MDLMIHKKPLLLFSAPVVMAAGLVVYFAVLTGHAQVEVMAQSADTQITAALTSAAETKRSVIIKPGNSLWSIAQQLYGDGRLYVTLLNANKTLIENPQRIYPGQVLFAPKAMDN